MRRVVLLLVFFVAVAVAASVYWRSGPLMHGAEAQSTAQKKQRDASPAVPVVLAQARRMTLPVLFSTIGTIQPMASIAVTSQVAGIVSEVDVSDGAAVKQGDVLIALDSRLIDTQIEQAKATIAKDNAG